MRPASQRRVLAYLLDHPNATAGKIADELQADAEAITRTLLGLERMGVVEYLGESDVPDECSRPCPEKTISPEQVSTSVQ